MIKLSKPSKMPCFSWSLQALDTCPGSKKADGGLVDACVTCYATDGNYRFSNVKAPRVHNRADWKRADWVPDMIKILDNSRYFRWFDSGDCYDLRLAEKILEVMKATAWCKHWLPTRQHKFSKFLPVLEAMQELDNVVVRYSSDSVHGETVAAKNSSTIVQYSVDVAPVMTECKAYAREGKCQDCRACWSKEVKIIAYIAHGRKARKLYKLIASDI